MTTYKKSVMKRKLVPFGLPSSLGSSFVPLQGYLYMGAVLFDPLAKDHNVKMCIISLWPSVQFP